MKSRIQVGIVMAMASVTFSQPGFPEERSPSPQPSPSPRGGLAWVEKTQKVHIEDHWMGLSPLAPMGVDYELQRLPDGGLGGEALFAVRGLPSGKPSTSTTAAIQIPAAVVTTFFQELAGSTLKPGPYQPNITHTDDYPSFVVRLENQDQKVVFRSSSQGEENVPWACDPGDGEQVVEGNAPSRALKALAPYLQREKLNDLVKETMKHPRGP